MLERLPGMKFVRLEAELPISGSWVLFWRVAQEPATGLPVDDESSYVSKTLPLWKKLLYLKLSAAGRRQPYHSSIYNVCRVMQNQKC
jgi:hypothetical protein